MFGGCSVEPPSELGTLVLRDSTYLAPETLEPFSGRVLRHFADAPDKVQVEGTLANGTWEGELTVYHRSGRIRFQGRLAAGVRCGAWVENREDVELTSVYETLIQDVESMGIYPDCPEPRGILSRILRR